MKRALSLVAAAMLLVAVAAPAAQAASKAEGSPGWMGFVSSVDYPAGTFNDGQTYTYWSRVVDPTCGCDELMGPPVTFTVSKDAPLYPGYVQLRFWGFVAIGDLPDPMVINPAQPTRFEVVWYWTPADYTHLSDIKAVWDTQETLVSFAGLDGPWTLATDGPVQNLSAANGMYTWINDKWHIGGTVHRS